MLNKTIKELAEEFGVTKQTIQYHLKSLPTKETTKSDKGHILIKPNGQSILRERIQVKSAKEADKTIDKETLSLSVIKLLEKQLDETNLQLIEKDKQLASMQKLLDQQQQLMQAEQKKNQLLLEEAKQTIDTEKNGFFNRLFGGSKKQN